MNIHEYQVKEILAGKSAPRGRRMGHAGAIAEDVASSAAVKMEALFSRGVPVIEDPTCMGEAVGWMLKGSPLLEWEEAVLDLLQPPAPSSGVCQGRALSFCMPRFLIDFPLSHCMMPSVCIDAIEKLVLIDKPK